jgi:hypothetical protein
MKEALKLALEALDALCLNDYSGYEMGKRDTHLVDTAIDAIKAALAQPAQEPDHGDELTIAYMSGVHRGKELAAQPAPVQPVGIVETLGGYPDESRHEVKWLVPYGDLKDGDKLYRTPQAQPAQERNFCSRCGKRTADLTVIHTCTPPQENT